MRTAGAGLLALLPALALAPAEAAAGAVCPATDTVDLIAGRDSQAGDVKVCNDADYLYVTYEPTGPWCVADTNLHVATDLDGIPRTRSGNPKPDEFAYGGPPEWDECTVTFEIPLDEIGGEGVEAGDEVAIAAQADLFVLESTRREGAWAAGTRFTERGPWATYFTYTVEELCGGESSRCVFVTSTQHAGDLGSLPGIGDYLAWLSDDVDSPSTRFVKDATSYRLVDGTLVAAGWSDLTDGELQHAINLTESGITVTGGTGSLAVWTGTDANGTSTTTNCSQWTSLGSPGGGTLGLASVVNLSWTRFSDLATCSQSGRLYCFQQP